MSLMNNNDDRIFKPQCLTSYEAVNGRKEAPDHYSNNNVLNFHNYKKNTTIRITTLQIKLTINELSDK